jgi:hypothetical protein
MSVGYVGVIILRVQTVRECQTEPLGKVSAAAYLTRIAETNVTTVQECQTEPLGKVIADAYLLRIAETNVTTVRECQTEILL